MLGWVADVELFEWVAVVGLLEWGSVVRLFEWVAESLGEECVPLTSILGLEAESKRGNWRMRVIYAPFPSIAMSGMKTQHLQRIAQ